ncbi:helix-turn-helix transcriptional regulator [Streptomyces sp. NBC_00124]|uniref:helix-turn-helix transcriptional regulator n=1 Tax=Streptomyces sp. NBC_00124 TaxID=2975662 RepID=UPI002254CCFA|nr:helix-turn-helix transcriptional regulator [Streptomyces sp. NBC_00124]MCX5367224.1 helix-turn-helix transcriptional regulator [Streptomyces sp. NBC_00124]
MDDRAEISQFLSSRRAGITPEQAGLPTYGGYRRVKGLRREEVALLAGVSIDYYVRMERGNLSGASDHVLNGVARALQLDDAERDHLYDLARRAPAPATPRRRAPARGLRPALQHMLDAVSDAPAWIHNGRQDLLATNHLARALYAPLLADPRRPANAARFIYLDPAAHDFFPDWDSTADGIAAMLRAEAGRNPYDKDLSDLIGELSTRSETFRRRWADRKVRRHRTGAKKLHHPVVGDLELHFETMPLSADPGLTLVIYTATPNTPSADALRLLATWAATQDQPTPDLHDHRP